MRFHTSAGTASSSSHCKMLGRISLLTNRRVKSRIANWSSVKTAELFEPEYCSMAGLLGLLKPGPSGVIQVGAVFYYAAVFESEDRAERRLPFITLIGIEKGCFNHHQVADRVGPFEANVAAGRNLDDALLELKKTRSPFNYCSAEHRRHLTVLGIAFVHHAIDIVVVGFRPELDDLEITLF